MSAKNTQYIQMIGQPGCGKTVLAHYLTMYLAVTSSHTESKITVWASQDSHLGLPGSSPSTTKRGLVESREAIMPRPSLLDPDVPISVHPAPDVLGFRVCSCGCNRGKIREPLEGYFYSNYYGCHQHDGDVPSLH